MKNKALFIVLAIVLCLALVIGVCAKVYLDKHLWTGHGFVARDAEKVDFRGTALTVEDYENLHQQLPYCEILWDVPFQGGLYASNTQVLTVDSLSQEDLKMLEYFPGLTMLDASGCTDTAALDQFRSARPDCQILYQVEIGGVSYSWDTSALEIWDADLAALQQQLPLLPNASSVMLRGTLSDIDALEALTAQFPQIHFSWNVNVGADAIDSNTAQLDLSGKDANYSEIAELLRWMPNLEKVNLQNCGLEAEEVAQLALANPNCSFHCEISVAGNVFSTDVEEIDISGQPVSSAEEIEAILPCFSNLKKVIMSDCGLSNEEMDALNNRHEDIRFIWTVYVQNHPLRTDADYFYPYKMDPNMRVTDEDMELLRYCPDILCIDIGHMWYVTHCEWVRYLPKLKYLILGETRVSDLTPLSTCKNLVYLEIFTIPVTDYSPLVECTALEDLCLGRTYGDPAPIAKMTWLKNVWWANVHGTVGLPASNAKAVLEAALPNTVLRFDIAHPTADGWRQLQNYFDHRDLMGMHYLQ